MALVVCGILFLISLTQLNSTSAQVGATYKIFLPVVSNKTNKLTFDFSPYVDGQDPNLNTFVPEAQIRQRMQIVAPYANWIRTFACGNGLEVAGRVAHEMGIRSAVNAWIGKSDVINQQQIACLIQQANAGYVDIAIVGSEALLRGDVSASTLMGYIDQVRQAIPSSIPVATADVYGTFLANPGLVAKVDIIFANIYPFWESYPIQSSVAMVNYYYHQLTTAYPTKRVYISETGWPSCGVHGNAIGSLDNEVLFFSRVESWARDQNVTLFYFEAFDESWKASYEGPQGACWGIWDKNGNLKPGMSSVLADANVPYDLTLPLTCNTNQFSFNFTYVPPYGSFDNVQGQTCGVFNQDYRIVLYIYVNSSWWVKPYANAPKTFIDPSGSWTVDYTTGGVDQSATEIRAYLIPANADVSTINPSGTSIYPMISVTRSPTP
jgi:exo-beta-1,3-glucanase (GH17 family)